MAHTLPKELTSLVDWSVSELGRVIESELGPEGFRRIENIRQYVKSEDGQKLQGLLKLKKELTSLSALDRYYIAHSFALMLELINACEAAYRTSRLKMEFKEGNSDKHHTYGRIIHVLTAHPTESRNPDIIYYFKKIQSLLQRQLENPSDQNLQELHVFLKWVWRIPMSKQRKPSVMDEAEYIYSLTLQNDILKVFIDQRKQKLPFYIRTWVGGDKDGHPGVDEKTMVGSLQMARKFLLKWVQAKFQEYLEDLEPLSRSSEEDKRKVRALMVQSKKIKLHFSRLKKIQHGDSHRLQSFKEAMNKLSKGYKALLTVESPILHEIHVLMKIFPGLVVPLELREDSALVHEALKSTPQKFAISRMLKTLARISPEHDPRFYVRGFVLSHTESAQDIVAGVSLSEKYLGKARLPVVPLFESAHALKSSVAIIEELLKSPQRRKLIKDLWSEKLEVMLGYSDSAKENGSFPSRFLIYEAIQKLEKVIRKHDLTPIFFHGSGGSVERGGGSVQEQTEWWPLSALSTVKVTVQGEMIYRNYTAPEILERQLDRFQSARDVVLKKGTASSKTVENDLSKLSDFIQSSYQEILKDPHFLELIEWATPYGFLKDLRFGSRPSKRQGSVNLDNLRAIPWVLCWTQTRALFPSWWGVGSFWQTLSPQEKNQYKKAFAESSLFRSYVKVLGFTLEKIELSVFSLYLHSSRLPQEVADSFVERFEKEFTACQKAVKEITGQKSLLWYRPWLETSIALRSPLIHPLNVLQLLALEDQDVPLLRETVTGIASGMLTTG